MKSVWLHAFAFMAENGKLPWNMRSDRPVRCTPLKVRLAVLGAIFALVVIARATVPHIYLFEPINPNLVAIHFEMDAFRSYTVQYTSSFIVTSNGITAVWTDLETVPTFPFNNHWVSTDTRSATARFYRLKVVP